MQKCVKGGPKKISGAREFWLYIYGALFDPSEACDPMRKDGMSHERR